VASDFPRQDFSTREIARMLTVAGKLSCRSSHEQGCRCQLHVYPTVVRLNVQTIGPTHDLEHPCDGSMVCGCQRCVGERLARVANGVRVDPSDPFIRRLAA
jgi:hypothetical protein